MITNLRGRIKNTSLPKTNAPLSLLEVVVNLIHSIDERIEHDVDFSISDGRIEVNVLRDSTIMGDQGDLIGFEVVDNGIGFNEKNYTSFNTLDTDYKAAKGCHGVGRLLWLKVFADVSVKSVYDNGDHYFKREFLFSDNGITGHTNERTNEVCCATTVTLKHIKDSYSGIFPVKASTIARLILEHCIWYFMREGSAPTILVKDSQETINLNQEYESYMLGSSETESFTIKKTQFDIVHVKFKHTKDNAHWLYYCAANRIVEERKLTGRIPGLFDALIDSESDKEFYYSCYLSSDFLTDNVSETRLGFNIPTTADGLFNNSEISFDEINNELFKRISVYLAPYVESNISQGKNLVEKYVSEKAPRYKSILKHIPESDLIINPKTSDKDLELTLHSHLMNVEAELISEGHDLMSPSFQGEKKDYLTRIHDYLDKASDLKQSDLANYVTHRKVIIDLFREALNIKEDGKYSKEEVLHQLIMPMRRDSEDVLMDDTNLWLVDERLAFHNYLASDKTLKSMPITDSSSSKEPDICAINIYDNPLLVNEGSNLPLASLTVIELKRPMRDDAKSGIESDPIEQALDYVNRIRQGKVTTKDGRIIPNAKDIPAFCYILCDLTPSMTDRCYMHDLKPTSDKMGFFGYKSHFNAYVEVISFDRLANQAAQRNRAFFDKLGLPTT